jgi:hypothetical protein
MTGFGYLGASARDKANQLYSELSDTYQTALSLGVDRMFPTEMEDAGNKIKLAAKSFRSTSEDVILSTVKSFHTELMPKLQRLMAAEKQAYPSTLPPPPKIVPVPGAEIPGGVVPSPSPDSDTVKPWFPSPQPAPIRVGSESPWYLAGGVDWRIISGIAGSLLVLTLLLRRK